MESDQKQGRSADSVIGDFFRQRVVGMILFAVVMGILASFLYDRMKGAPPEPSKPAVVAAPSLQPIQINNSNTLVVPPIAHVEPAVMPTTLPQKAPSAAPAVPEPRIASPTPQLSEHDKVSANREFDRGRDSAWRLKDQQDAETQAAFQLAQAAAQNGRSLALAAALERQKTDLRNSPGDPGFAVQTAYEKAIADSQFAYNTALNAASSKYKQALADSTGRYEDTVAQLEAKRRDKLLSAGR